MPGGRRAQRWVLPFLFGGVAWLAPAAAGAADGDDSRRFSLEYTAAAGCPNAATLVSAIQLRTAGTLLVDPPAPVAFRVALGADGAGTLWIEVAGGTSRRELKAASCADAVTATAVIASMVLEATPQARLGAPDSATTTPGSAGERLENVESPPPAPPEPPRPPAAATSQPPAPAAAHEKAPAKSWHVSGLAGGTLETSVAPSAPLGILLGLEAERGSAHIWEPIFRGELLATASALEHTSVGDATFRLTAARIEGCTLKLQVGALLGLMPCLTFDAGSLSAAGSGAAQNTAERSMPWLALGLTVRARVALSNRAALEVFAGLRRLYQHDRFVFGPDNLPAYEVRPFSFGLGVELSWRAL